MFPEETSQSSGMPESTPSGITPAHDHPGAFSALETSLQLANQELERRIAERTAQLEQANVALRESEERNQLAMEIASMFAFEWEPATDVVKRSSHCGRILGLTEAAVERDTGVSFFQRVHPDDRDHFIACLQTLTPEHNTYKTTYRVARPDGQVVTLEESGRAFFDSQGQISRLIGMTADVTERQRMQAELEASRATLQRQLAEIETIYQSAPIGLNVLDADLRFVRINQRLADINGLSVEAHLGRTVRELLPGLADVAEQILRPILVTGEPLLNVELRGETPAQPGVERVWLESFLPLKDGDRVIGINTVCEEITERQRAEAALRESEEFKQRMLESSNDCIKVLDLDGRMLYLNPGGRCLLEIDDFASVHHADWALLWPAAMRPIIREAIAAAKAGESKRFQGYCPTVKDTPKWWDVVVTPIHDVTGQVIQLLSISRDITEIKQSEEALRQSEERYRTLFESMEDGFCVIEMLFNDTNTPTDYRFLEINPTFVRLTGLKGVVGKTARQIIPQLQEFFVETYGKVALTGESARFEVPSQLGNGWFEVYAFPIGKQESHKVAVLFKDVSDRKAVETQREHLLQQEQAAREAAEQANRIKDEFLAVLSHELRTPLNPILGWAKLLQSSHINADKLQQGLSTIERNAKQQVQLIDDLLDSSRIIRGKLTLNLAAIDVAIPIMAALETVRFAAEAKAIQVDVLLNPTMTQVRGDVGRLQQVFWNLLSNAIKFTPSGGRVTVQLAQIGSESMVENRVPQLPLVLPLQFPIPSYAQITITDTGKGIKPDFLPHVFELFRQQDSSTTRSFSGLGLGLAIARQVVEAHGGTITVSSAGEGHGATFTVLLPLMATISPHLPAAVQPQLPTLAKLRVMVVDDENDSLELIRILLEQEGAVVKTVSLATEAVRMMLQSQFDLLISDIGMPQMDGYMFIRQVRALPPQFNRDIPAIALTAYAGETNRRQILAAGFQAHLAKPIEPQNLLTEIATVIAR